MAELKKNKIIAGFLAIFLGTLGIHRFYMGEWKVGLAYLIFFWTGIPTILGIIDGARYFTEDAESDSNNLKDTASNENSETISKEAIIDDSNKESQEDE